MKDLHQNDIKIVLIFIVLDDMNMIIQVMIIYMLGYVKILMDMISMIKFIYSINLMKIIQI